MLFCSSATGMPKAVVKVSLPFAIFFFFNRGRLPFLLAYGAKAKKIQLVVGDLIAGLPGHFQRELD
jgi:hypothetical protein